MSLDRVGASRPLSICKVWDADYPWDIRVKMVSGEKKAVSYQLAAAVESVADDVQTVVLPGAGHWVAEQAPEELLAVIRDAIGLHALVSERNQLLDDLRVKNEELQSANLELQRLSRRAKIRRSHAQFVTPRLESRDFIQTRGIGHRMTHRAGGR